MMSRKWLSRPRYIPWSYRHPPWVKRGSCAAPSATALAVAMFHVRTTAPAAPAHGAASVPGLDCARPRRPHAAMVHEAPLKIYARGVVSYFYFSRAPRARAENQANQQCHFKSSRWRMDPLGTDSCRGTVPMEPPMSNGSNLGIQRSMRHREPKSEIDDPGHSMRGASRGYKMRD
jgi:hypothetical protein